MEHKIFMLFGIVNLVASVAMTATFIAWWIQASN
jgi:hypothetical protein